MITLPFKTGSKILTLYVLFFMVLFTALFGYVTKIPKRTSRYLSFIERIHKVKNIKGILKHTRWAWCFKLFLTATGYQKIPLKSQSSQLFMDIKISLKLRGLYNISVHYITYPSPLPHTHTQFNLQLRILFTIICCLSVCPSLSLSLNVILSVKHYSI